MIDHSQWLDSIVRASWQGALLVLAAWVALRLLKTAPARFRSWIWPIVLTKFVLVALFVWELPVLAPSKVVAQSITIPVMTSGATIQYVYDEPVAVSTWSFQQTLFLLWILGVALIVARAIRDYALLKRIAARAAPASARIARLCERVAGKPLEVRSHPDVPMPLVFGVIKPVILLPSGIEDDLSEEQLSMVLAHEAAHIQRRDTATAVYVFLCQALFFFNPAVWIAKREWQMARESACDQYAMARTGADCRQYADMLIEISAGARRAPAFALSAVPAYKTLHRRIDDMNRTQNKTMAARLASLVVVALIAAAALPVAFVQKQGSIGEAIFSQLSKSRSKTSQVTVLPAPLESKETATVSESELVRVALGQAHVAALLRVQAMDVALTQVVPGAASQILAADVATARGILVRSLQVSPSGVGLVRTGTAWTFVEPKLTVQEAGVLKVTADGALMRLYLEPTRTVSFNKQKADQNEKYIALLEKYIALLEKHLKSIGGAPDPKVAYAIPPSGGKLPGFVPRAVPDASSAGKAATAAYVKAVLSGEIVDLKSKVQIKPIDLRIEVAAGRHRIANVVVLGRSKASKEEVAVKVVEVDGKTFWIAARPKAKIKVNTKEGTIQIVEVDGKKFWVALKPGTVKAEGTKLEIKVVEIEGKKIWIVRTPRKKERADKKGG